MGLLRVATSRKGKYIVVFAVVVPIVLFAMLIVNWFVYPFVSAKPNFADVEAVYNKMVVPADWVKKGEGSNKGIAGRQCPIESDGCFSKYTDYTLPKGSTKDVVLATVLSSGCVSASEEDKSQKGGKASIFSYTCMSGPVRVIGSWEQIDDQSTARLTIKSR